MDTEHEGTTGEGRSDDPAEQGISRKKFIAGTAAAGAAIGLGATGAALGARKAPATPKAHANNPDREFEGLVLTKGKIHTMDGSNRVVDEILIKNGRIVEVGNHVDKHRTDEGREPQGQDGRPRDHRQPQPHHPDGEPARVSHAARERLLGRRRPADATPRAPPAFRRAAGSRPSAAFTPTTSRSCACPPAGARRRGARGTRRSSCRASPARRRRTASARRSSRRTASRSPTTARSRRAASRRRARCSCCVRRF